MSSTRPVSASPFAALGRATRGALACALLAGLIVGLPWGLVVYVGWPLPRHVPAVGELRTALLNPLDARTLLDILACLLWPVWARFAWDVLRCVPTALRAIPAPALPGRSGPLHAVATVLVGMVAASLISPRSPAAVGPGAALGGLERPVVTVAAPRAPGLPPSDLTDHQDTLVAAMVRVRQPERGVHDSLWRIAERQLGDGARWPEIWALNAEQVQADGRTFIRPTLIQPGWLLRLPVVAASQPPPPARDTTAAAQPAPAVPATPAHARPTHASGGIDASTGAFVGAGLAAAVGTALLVLRRRQRRVYAPGSGVRDDLVVAPIVRELASAGDEATQCLDLPAGAGPAPAGSPRTVQTGQRDGRAVAVDLAQTRGLGLVGPGAHDAARALLVTLLADTRLGAAELVITAELATTLLGDPARCSALGGVRVVDSLRHALDHLEAELFTRARQAADPAASDESPRPMVLVAQPCASEERRLQGVLDNGSTLGFAGVLVGQWRPGGTVHVRAGGTVAATSPELAEAFADSRVFTLPAPDAAALVDLLAAAVEAHSEPTTEVASPPPPATPIAPVVAAPRPAPQPSRQSRADLTLKVLGRLRLEDCRQEPAADLTEALPRKQREILAFLALHPAGARREAVATAIWPEAPGDRPYNSFHATLSQLRRALRDADNGFTRLVQHQDGHYNLDANLVAVDLWQLTERLTAVRASADDQQRQAALSEAIDLYAGDLADGLSGEWLEAPREALRRDVLDAISAVSRDLRADNPERALALLERARALDPYNEAIYRDIARLQARLGRFESISRTLGLLTGALAEIDQRPAADTVALCEALQRRDEAGHAAG